MEKDICLTNDFFFHSTAKHFFHFIGKRKSTKHHATSTSHEKHTIKRTNNVGGRGEGRGSEKSALLTLSNVLYFSYIAIVCVYVLC